MNNLAFTASVVGSLAIPATVVVALLIFRRPLTNLLGRIISYEGLGQKVNFGQKLAGAEESVSKAVAQAQQAAEEAKLEGADIERPTLDRSLWKITSTEQDPQNVDLRRAGLIELAELASANPSFVVIKAWEDLETELVLLVESAFPETDIFVDPLPSLPDLVRRRLISESFLNAVLELRDLRNSVAHGKQNPTAGEAVAFVESTRELSTIATVAGASLRAVRDANRGAVEALEVLRSQEQPDGAPVPPARPDATDTPT
jgi:hypothetical protein